MSLVFANALADPAKKFLIVHCTLLMSFDQNLNRTKYSIPERSVLVYTVYINVPSPLVLDILDP